MHLIIQVIDAVWRQQSVDSQSLCWFCRNKRELFRWETEVTHTGSNLNNFLLNRNAFLLFMRCYFAVDYSINTHLLLLLLLLCLFCLPQKHLNHCWRLKLRFSAFQIHTHTHTHARSLCVRAAPQCVSPGASAPCAAPVWSAVCRALKVCGPMLPH